MLNIATSKDQGLNLVKGEVLRGVVQEVKADGLVSLLIKGQVIDAVSEVMVQNGQTLQLMVEDFKDGRAYLKVLTPQLLERIENTNLSVNLKDIGVPAKESNVIMARKLLAHNLPVTVSNLNELSKGMNVLGGSNPRNLELAAFALQRGIPLNQQNLNALAQFTLPGNGLVQLMDEIMNSLASLERLSAQEPAAPGNLSGEPASAGNKSAAPESLPASQNQVQTENSGAKTNAQVSVSSKGNQEAALSSKSNITGENAPSMVKAANAETGAVPARMEAGASVQPGQDLAGTKTNAEGAAAQKAGTSADKTGPGQTPQTAVKTGNEQVKPAEGKAAAAAPVPIDEQITRSAAAGSDKLNSEIRAAVKAVAPEITRAAGNVPETASELSKEGAGNNKNIATGEKITTSEKIISQTAQPTAGKTAAEPAASTTGKAVNEQGIQMAGKETQALPNAADGKTPAPGGPQVNKTEPEFKLPAGPGLEKTPEDKQNNPQSPTLIKPGDLTGGKENVLTRTNADAPIDKLAKHLELLKPLLDILRIDAGENKGTLGAKLENALNSEKELIKGLMLLEDIIKNDRAAIKNPIINDLLQKINGLEKDLSGQRILNFAASSNVGNMVDSNLNYFYFSFPMQMGNEYRLGQIRINKEIGRRGLKNQDNIRFIVSLDTSQMGLVLFHLNWKRSKEIEVQGVVENQKVCNFLNRNIEVLLQGLNGLGYKTKNLGIKVAAPEEELGNLKLTMEETPLNIRPLGIDITV